MIHGGRPTECDLVMKGGITSGIVYPSAIAAIAGRFTLRNLGGASAGAIAAAVAAAAEFRRRDPAANDPFAELRELSAELAQGENLRRLFIPQRATQPAWQMMEPLLLRRGWARKLLGLLRGALGGVGALLVGLTVVVLALSRGGAVLSALALAVVLVGTVLLQGLRAWRAIEANQLGLCSGMPDLGARTDRRVAAMSPAEQRVLMPWLHLKLQGLAGVDLDRPLTFGQLWGLPPGLDDASARAHHQAQWKGHAPRRVTLELLTTDLTSGRPQRAPFDDDLYIRDADLARLFPEEVVRWMTRHGTPHADDAAYLKLPDPWDLPVIVAVRLSLSFPMLFSVVPLHRLVRGRMVRCWFADGGILSNFPIHLFDALLPDRPTFGINLRYDFGDGEPDADRVFLPTSGDGGGVAEVFDRFGSVPPTIVDYALAMLRALQDWQDNSQLLLPGFRDRIVHLRLRKSEGGLNLSMPPASIEALIHLGTRAGEALCARFAVERGVDEQSGEIAETPWDAQRRLRFRCAASMLGRVAMKLNLVAEDYAALMAGERVGPAANLRCWSGDAQLSSATELIGAVCAEGQRLEAVTVPSERLEFDAPRPDAVLRVTSRHQG